MRFDIRPQDLAPAGIKVHLRRHTVGPHREKGLDITLFGEDCKPFATSTRFFPNSPACIAAIREWRRLIPPKARVLDIEWPNPDR